jgi:hypothetical protein
MNPETPKPTNQPNQPEPINRPLHESPYAAGNEKAVRAIGGTGELVPEIPFEQELSHIEATPPPRHNVPPLKGKLAEIIRKLVATNKDEPPRQIGGFRN